MAHMGELMGEHAGDLLRREQPHEPGVDGDGGMLGIAPGGEGIGLIVVDHIDLGHGQSGALGQLADQAIKLRGARLVDLPRAIHGQHHAVGIPIGEEVHRQGEEESDDHALAPGDEIADDEEDPGEGCEKQHGADIGHPAPPVS